MEINDVHLLPYHRLGKEKYSSLGRAYAFRSIPPQKEEAIQELAKVPRELGLQVQIGG